MKVDPDKKKKYLAYAKETVYWEACLEKGERLEQKVIKTPQFGLHHILHYMSQDPWKKFRARLALGLIFLGWIFFAMIVYQISLFDYEMANFDPYEILEVNRH